LESVQVTCLTAHLSGDVVKEGTGGTSACRKIGATKSIERVNFEMRAEDIRCRFGFENITIKDRAGVDGRELVGLMVGNENFGWRDASEFVE
jgi:hypothetical protein